MRVYNSSPNYFLPGIDPRYTPAVCFFENLGFQKYRQAIIPCVGPVCFYSKTAGAVIDRIFWQYEKEI